MSAHWRAFCEKKVNIFWLSHSLLQVHQSLLPVNISFLMPNMFLPISFSLLLLLPLGIVLFLMVSLRLSLSLHLIIPFQLHETWDHIHTWQWNNITLHSWALHTHICASLLRFRSLSAWVLLPLLADYINLRCSVCLSLTSYAGRENKQNWI